jgi:PEGA domain
MSKVEASNLLRTNLGASMTELETAYCKRREEVRKRFEAARDRNTRTQCEREYFALEQARDLLLAESDDLLGGDERPAVERHEPVVEDEEQEIKLKAALVEGEGLRAESKAPSLEDETPAAEPEEQAVKLRASLVGREEQSQSVDRKEPSLEPERPALERQASLVRDDGTAFEGDNFLIPREEILEAREKLLLSRRASPAKRAEPMVGRRNLPIKRVLPLRGRVPRPIGPVPSPIKRVFGAIEPALSLQRVVRPIAGIPSSTKGVAEPSGNGSSPIEDVSSPKAVELRPLEPVLEQGRNRSIPKDRRTITGVVLILVLASVVVFILLRAADQPKQGTLVVNTIPDGAVVWLDQVPRGKTPLILEDVTPGDRRLTIKLPGYRAEEIVVSVKPGDEGSTRIVQLVPVQQPSPKPIDRPSSNSRPGSTIVPPAGSRSLRHPRDPRQ